MIHSPDFFYTGDIDPVGGLFLINFSATDAADATVLEKLNLQVVATPQNSESFVDIIAIGGHHSTATLFEYFSSKWNV